MTEQAAPPVPTHKIICRLKNGTIKKYEVDGVDNVHQARDFVISQVKDVRAVLGLVNNLPKPPSMKPSTQWEPDDQPPLKHA